MIQISRYVKSEDAQQQSTRKAIAMNTMKRMKKHMQITYTTIGVTCNNTNQKGKTMTSAGKFRISLNLDQINWIIANCQAELPDLHKQLVLLKTKAELGYTKPAYEIQPQRERVKKTNLIDNDKSKHVETQYMIALNYLERGQTLTPELQSAYDEYRYLNDLMTPEESSAYEQVNEF